MKLAFPAQLVRRLFVSLALLALALWWMSLLEMRGTGILRRAAVVLLLTAPWTAVVACLVVAVRRRLWLRVAVAAALLLVGVASWLA